VIIASEVTRVRTATLSARPFCCCRLGTASQQCRHHVLQAHKAASDAAAVRQELAAAQERAEQATAAAAQAAAQAAAAREAEQRLQQQLAGEQRRSDKVGGLRRCSAAGVVLG